MLSVDILTLCDNRKNYPEFSKISYDNFQVVDWLGINKIIWQETYLKLLFKNLKFIIINN